MKKKTDPYTAGEFRSPVAVQRATSSDDGSGGQTKVWATVIPTVWCAIENKQGGESYQDKARGRVMAEQTFSFTTWFREDVLVTDRLLFQGQLFNIRQVNDLDLRRKFSQFVAESGVEQ